MNILIIESSTDAASVALQSNGQIYAEHIVGQRRHNDVLLPLVQSLCASANITPIQLDQVVFGSGPGSFTGTRIGASIAQGIAIAAQAKLLALSSFQLMAQGIHQTFEVNQVLIAFDARKDEIYAGLYRLSDGIMQGEPKLLKPASLCIAQNEICYAAGDAWFRLYDQMPRQDKLHFERNIQNWLPRAQDGFGLLAQNQAQTPQITYLRSACDWEKWKPH